MFISLVQPKADQPSAEAVGNVVFYVYVLRSVKNSKRYIGYTGKAPAKKLKEHNGGATKWTRQNGPFVRIYQESYEQSKIARQRELFLKSGKGRQWLDKTLAARAGSP